jgi:large subunit ribosomal protein L43
MESHLPTFKEKNPQLEVVTELSRGQHPFLKGLYSKASLILLRSYNLVKSSMMYSIQLISIEVMMKCEQGLDD